MLIDNVITILFNLLCQLISESSMKKSNKNITFSFEQNWQEIAKLEASLGKIFRSSSGVYINQDELQVITKSIKQLLKCIDILRHQQKHHKGIQESYNLMQAKISNHQNIVNNLQKGYNQRCKSLIQQARSAREQMQKIKKNAHQIEDQCTSIMNSVKYEKIQLQQKIANLQRTRQRLLQQLASKDEEIKGKDDSIKRLKNSIDSNIQLSPKNASLGSVLCSSLSSKILSYLNPIDGLNLRSLNKQIRMYVIKNKSCGDAIMQSINKVKNRTIAYFHKHIEYFEKLAQKVPQQILHTTFYQFHIAKQSIGPQILSILNSSASIFQGKFMDVDIDDNSNENALQTSFNKIMNNAYINILEVDESIIKQYIQQKKTQRDKAMKQIDLMYKKIHETAKLYSADVQSIQLFMKNVLKNFSKVFVLSKNLYSQARNLHCLNQFLLNQLVTWDKDDIKSKSIIQDLKAQLEAQKKLKLFFTDKSQKSEKKALSEQNSKLNIEMKYNQCLKNLDQIHHDKKVLQTKLEQIQKALKTVTHENRELKKAYEAGKQKYHQIIEQLSVVRETIIRMNLV